MLAETLPGDEERDSPSALKDAATIISLTVLGGLDEVAYFPSLLLTKTYSPLELYIGTLVAAAVIWTIIQVAVSGARQCITWHIPLWIVVSMYGIVMTVLFVMEWNEAMEF